MPRKILRGNLAVSGNLTVTGTLTPALGVEYADDAFTIKNATTAGKKVRVSAAGVTDGQTRILTSPDYNGTLATLAGTEAFTNKTLTSPKVGTAILDTGGNEIIKTPANVSAVNELTISNAATGVSPSIVATGDDTDISVLIGGKGTGRVVALSRVTDFMTAAILNTASDQTYTVAHLLGGLLLRDPAGGARADTLPSAVDLLAAIPGAVVGTAFEWTLRNTADQNETITVGAGAGGTVSGTATVAQNNTKRFLIVLTNVTAAAEAYTAYSLGTLVH